MEKNLVQHYKLTNTFPQSLVYKKNSTCKLGIDSYEPYQSCTSLFQLGIGKSTSGERFVWKTQSIHYKPKYHSAFQNLYRRKPRKVGYFVRCLYCPSKKWAAMAASLRPHDLNEELWLKLLYPSKNLKWYIQRIFKKIREIDFHRKKSYLEMKIVPQFLFMDGIFSAKSISRFFWFF